MASNETTKPSRTICRSAVEYGVIILQLYSGTYCWSQQPTETKDTLAVQKTLAVTVEIGSKEGHAPVIENNHIPDRPKPQDISTSQTSLAANTLAPKMEDSKSVSPITEPVSGLKTNGQKLPLDSMTTNPAVQKSDDPKTIIPKAEQATNQNTGNSETWYNFILRTEIWVMIFTGGMAFIAYLQWDTSKAQLKQMQGQLEQMQGGSAQTDRIIAEANAISASLQESLKQSKAALDASIESSRTDLRAWVGVVGVVAVQQGQNTRFDVTYANTGKTPAIITFQQASLYPSKAYPLPNEFDQQIKLDKSQISRGMLFSNATGTMMQTVTPEMLKGFFGDYTGVKYIFLDGVIEYEDVFGKKHHTAFCYFHSSHNQNDERLYMAPNRNSAD